MASVTFIYNGAQVNVPCLKDEKMKDICNKFTTKINTDINSLFLIYGGNQLKNFDLTFTEQANSLDKERNEMTILVDKKEDEGLKCPKCGETINLDIFNDFLKHNNNQNDLLNVIKIQIENTTIIKDINLLKNQIKAIKILLDNLIKENEKYINNIQTMINNYSTNEEIPYNIEFKDITTKSLKAFWKINDNKIENKFKKFSFRVEIRKENSNDNFIEVYEGSDFNCSINNLTINTNYEIRICSVYNNLMSEWSKTEKVKTDYFDESIILNLQNKNQILNWLNPLYNGKNFCLKLIYRRGNDMSYETFHQKCDKKGPTLIVCKAKNEKFGGYTNIDWESCDIEKRKYDDGPFLFSLNKNKKYNYSNKDCHCIYLTRDHGPDFHWDLTFNDSNLKMKACICCTNNFGYAYSIEPLVGDGGLKEIEVDELEIFQVESK